MATRLGEVGETPVLVVVCREWSAASASCRHAPIETSKPAEENIETMAPMADGATKQKSESNATYRTIEDCPPNEAAEGRG